MAIQPITAFMPPRGLRNAHIQGLLSRWPGRTRRIEDAAAQMLAVTQSVLLHGEQADLLGYYCPASASSSSAAVSAQAPLAILLHGWEGSAESSYLLATAAALHGRGFAVLRLNLRDHGDSHHLNRELFHSNREAELADAIEQACQRWPADAYALVGFSLGGNFALRMGTRLPASLPIREIIAVCPVLDPAATLNALERGPFLYREYFLHKWRRSLQRKAALFPDLKFALNWRALPTLTAMTEHFVQHHTDYADLASYLRGYALVGERLQQLRFSAHMILTEDDPVIPIAQAQDLARSPLLSILRMRYGGHCAFVQDWRLNGWIEPYIAARLALACA